MIIDNSLNNYEWLLAQCKDDLSRPYHPFRKPLFTTMISKLENMPTHEIELVNSLSEKHKFVYFGMMEREIIQSLEFKLKVEELQ